MTHLKKFESFEEPLFQDSSWDWFLSHSSVKRENNSELLTNHLEFTDNEYNKILEFLSDTNSGEIFYNKQNTLLSRRHGAIFVSDAYGKKDVDISIRKCYDDWYFIRYLNCNIGFIKQFKCDELEGVSQCIEYLKNPKFYLN